MILLLLGMAALRRRRRFSSERVFAGGYFVAAIFGCLISTLLVESVIFAAAAPEGGKSDDGRSIFWKYDEAADIWVKLSEDEKKATLEVFPNALEYRKNINDRNTEGADVKGGKSEKHAQDKNDAAVYRMQDIDDSADEMEREAAAPWVHPSHGTYLLSSISETSVFGVPLLTKETRSVVYERYNNKAQWVYVRHKIQFRDTFIVTSMTSHGRLFVVDETGSLVERRRNSEDQLEWYVENPKEYAMRGPGMAAGTAESKTIYFTSADGTLLIRNVLNPHLPMPNPIPGQRETGVRWGSYRHLDHKFEALADVRTLRPLSVFAIDTKGQLCEIEFRDETILKNHGSPPKTRLSLVDGIAVRDISRKSGGSIFLRTEMGHLAEFRLDVTQTRFSWIDHGMPAPGAHVATPPGAVINDRSIFIVASTGMLFERYDDGKKWQWVDHGCPMDTKGDDGMKPLLLARVRGTAMSTRTLFFLVRDGRLAERTWNGHKWEWAVHDVPETGPASYCSNADPASPESCMPVITRAR